VNKEWSELNKTMQAQLRKKDTFQAGLETLFALRSQLMDTILSFRDALAPADFSAIPFINADGYHSKTVAYSLWHIFRIEDIVAHTLISGDEQIFFRGGYQQRIHAPIVTTGNELKKQQIADFSAQLDLNALYAYLSEVKESTEAILRGLSFEDLKRKISGERKAALEALRVVSDDENAHWLIDYWCGKDVRGLIQMPFSRHWIMHIEAALRIRAKLQPAA
jgi:hypothetical protein